MQPDYTMFWTGTAAGDRELGLFLCCAFFGTAIVAVCIANAVSAWKERRAERERHSARYGRMIRGRK